MQKMSEEVETPCSTPEHYQHAITPQQYADANELLFNEGNVVKYVTRHSKKGGSEDIIKAIHYCMFILDRDYGLTSKFSTEDEDGDIVKQLFV